VAIDRGKAVIISVRLDADECEQARRFARATGRTISALARLALRRYVEQHVDE
jgi:hypothetical protein